MSKDKNKVRTTFVLPAELVEKMREFVPSRKQSEFVAEAIEQRLMLMVYRQGRELSFGAWKDEDYPHLSSRDDVKRYISKLRGEDQLRRSTGEEG